MSAEILAQFPLVALVVFVALIVWREAKKLVKESEERQDKRDKEWQQFIGAQNQECRDWNDRVMSQTQAWQLEMAQTIGKLATKVDGVSAKVDMLVAKEYGTGPLQKGKRL